MVKGHRLVEDGLISSLDLDALRAAHSPAAAKLAAL
jgi:hypothetical protein